MNLTHRQLLRLGQLLDYPFTDNGLCQGFSAMWAQAVCSGKVADFNRRLQIIEEHANDFSMLEQKIAETRNKFRGEEGKGRIPTPQERAFLEIPAFYEGIWLYLRPSNETQLFGQMYQQPDLIKISEYAQSDALKEKGDLARAFVEVGQYDKDSLTAHLDKIKQGLENRSDTAILLTYNSHSVALRTLENGQFQFIDTNALYLLNKSFTSEELATHLLMDSLKKPMGILKYYFSLFAGPGLSSFVDGTREKKPIIMATEIFTPNDSPLKFDEKAVELPGLAADRNGLTVLHWAASHDDIATIKHINLSTIDINKKTNKGATALTLACSGGNKEIVDLLLGVPGIEIDENAFNYAIRRAPEIALKLVKHPNFSLENSIFSKTIFHVLAASSCKAVDAISLLKEAIKDDDIWSTINTEDDFSTTPIMIAAHQGSLELVNLFLEKGAQLDTFNRLGFNPLHGAVVSGNTALVTMLSNKGMDINQVSKGSSGQTSLHLACIGGNKAMVEKLISYPNISYDIHSED